MSTDPMQPYRNPIWMTVLGWIIGGLPALMFLGGGVANQFIPPQPEYVVMMEHIGWKPSSHAGLGVLMILCGVLYLIPRTAVLGALLATGYFGGALAIHVRVGDPLFPGFVMPLAFATLLWLGLVLRDARLRALLPWRSPATDAGAAKGGFFCALGKIVLTVAVIIALVAGLIATVPSEVRISRSTTIDAPPADVFPHVNDFHKWDPWTPWKELDPSAKTTFEGPSSGKGAIFKWDGNENIGVGTMTIVESDPDTAIKIKLQFEKPKEGTDDVFFTFKPDGNKTVVTWTMAGERNYPQKAIRLAFNLDKFISDRYDKGLAKLKSVVEGKK